MAPVLLDERPPDVIPDRLRVDQEAVEVEDDGREPTCAFHFHEDVGVAAG